MSEVDEKLLEVLSKSESAGEAFGRTVAIELDKMQTKERLAAQIEIQQVLLKYAQ